MAARTLGKLLVVPDGTKQHGGQGVRRCGRVVLVRALREEVGEMTELERIRAAIANHHSSAAARPPPRVDRETKL